MRSHPTTRLVWILGAVIPVFALGAQTPTQQSKSDGGAANARAQIESVNKRFTEAFNKGDVDGFVKVYAPDALILPPNSEPIRSATGIAEFWRNGWKAGLRNVVLTTTELSVHGNTAYEVGTAQLEIRKPDGSLAGKDKGKYIVIWNRTAPATGAGIATSGIRACPSLAPSSDKQLLSFRAPEESRSLVAPLLGMTGRAPR
jgi:ketosteroid isomerase-like protein